MKARIAHFRSPEAAAAPAELRVRPSDVFVAMYSKSGTTWMQQVVHQLRTGGDDDFEEISCVVPWLESARDAGIDPLAEQRGAFRAFKSHLSARDLPKGGRYITVFRDPESVLRSFYDYFDGWWFEAGSVSIEQFARGFYLTGSSAGRHWDHLVDWWPRRDAPQTLLLCYEDMVAAPHAVPPLVADFLGLSIDARKMDRVVDACSREHMARNVRQFDDHVLREARDPIWGLPAGGDSAKVRASDAGDRGRGAGLPEAVRADLDRVWQGVVTSVLGFRSYAELRAAMPNPLGVAR